AWGPCLAIPRRARAPPGRVRALGGGAWGPCLAIPRRARAPPGRVRALGGMGAISGPPSSYDLHVQVERPVDRPVRAVAAPGLAHHAGAVRAGVDPGGRARHPLRRAADGAVGAAARDGGLLRGILPQ